jgi:hypothetical protein
MPDVNCLGAGVEVEELHAMSTAAPRSDATRTFIEQLYVAHAKCERRTTARHTIVATEAP